MKVVIIFLSASERYIDHTFHAVSYDWVEGVTLIVCFIINGNLFDVIDEIAA